MTKNKLYPTKNPLLPLYLLGGLAASALACAIAIKLPPTPKVILAVAGFVGCTGVIGKTLLVEQETPMLDRNEVLLTSCHQKSVQCAARYYWRNIKAFNSGYPVSDSWYESYALHGGPPPLGLAAGGAPIVSLSPNKEAVALANTMTSKEFLAQDLMTMPELHNDLEYLTGQAPIDSTWTNSLLKYPYVLIYGAPGGGKTTFVQWLINQRIALGHSVFALDPHYEAGSWQFCEVKGAGLRYAEIDEFIALLTNWVKRRYMERQHKRGLVFQPITIICEELTRWANNCEKVRELINNIPDYRKVGVHLLLVAHGRSLPSLGGATGKRDMLNDALIELKLLVKPGKDGDPEPLMKGILKLPDQPPRQVQIPNIYMPEPEPVEPGGSEPGTQAEQEVYPAKPGGFSVPEPAESTKLTVVPDLEPEPNIEISAIEKSQFSKLRKQGKNKAEIIDLIWDCRKGGSERYVEASRKYNLLLEEEQVA